MAVKLSVREKDDGPRQPILQLIAGVRLALRRDLMRPAGGLLILLVVGTFSLKSGGEMPDGPGHSEQEIRAVESALTGAEMHRDPAHDAAVLDAVFDDDFMTTDILGHVMTKEQAMAAAKAASSTDLRMVSLENDEVVVRVYGNTGVVTGRTTAKGRAGGQDFNTQVRFTRVYTKRGDRWRLVASQVTRIAAP